MDGRNGNRRKLGHERPQGRGNGSMQGGQGGVEAGYTARKFLTKQGVTNILPVTAMLDRVNGASY